MIMVAKRITLIITTMTVIITKIIMFFYDYIYLGALIKIQHVSSDRRTKLTKHVYKFIAALLGGSDKMV